MPTKNPQEPFNRITVDEAKQMQSEGAQVIDVRNPDEYMNGHIPSAPLIPVNSDMMNTMTMMKICQLTPIAALPV